MGQILQYEQDVISERYSQPFRTLARLIFLTAGSRGGKHACHAVARIWFRLFCQPFSRFCIFPEVFLIGASKCGTSSMAAHLSSHPDCLPPFYKEPHYFNSGGIRSTRLYVYRAHFPTAAYRQLKQLVVGRKAWAADFTPTYYDHPHAPRRISETLGSEVKLIMMVRNPADRAFSQYRFQKGLGNEREESFERALELEASRVAGEAEKQLADESYFSRALNHFGYVTRGMYLPYIKNWHKYFKRSQLLIVRFEDFRASPQAAFDDVCDFIGAPRHRITQAIHNVSRGGESMSASTRAMLIATFRDHNREMSEYLGRDFAWDQ